MSDPTTTTPGSAFGVTQAAQPVSAAPFSAPSPEAMQTPAPEATVSAVPAAARGRLSDRLQKRKVKEVTVDLGDGDLVLVRGMDVVAVEEMNEAIRREDGDEAEGAPTKITKVNPRMLRLMCFDPEDGSRLFGTGQQIGVHPETDQPIIDGWTNEQINALPMDVVNRLMSAVNEVMGRTSEPGKDSRSTDAAASSS